MDQEVFPQPPTPTDLADQLIVESEDGTISALFEPLA